MFYVASVKGNSLPEIISQLFRKIATFWSINYNRWIKFRWLGLRISGSFPWQASGEIEGILCLFYFSISVTNGELLTALWHSWGDWERCTRQSLREDGPRECFKSLSVSNVSLVCLQMLLILLFKSSQLLLYNFNSGSVEKEKLCTCSRAMGRRFIYKWDVGGVTNEWQPGHKA